MNNLNCELIKDEDEYYLEQLLQMYEISRAPRNRDYPEVEQFMRRVASINLNRHYSKAQLRILAENYSELGAMTYDDNEDFFFSRVDCVEIRKLLNYLKNRKEQKRIEKIVKEQTKYYNLATIIISIIALIISLVK